MFHKNSLTIGNLSKLESWEHKNIEHPQEFGAYSFTFLTHKNFIYAFPHSMDALKKKHMSVYIFDTERLTWTKLKDYGQAPSQRKDFSVVKYNNAAYLYGGYSQIEKTRNDLFKFDFESQKWEEVEGEGKKRPLKRACHSACVYHDSMYIFGGGHDIHLHNDLFRFDFKTSEWHIMKPKGDIPTARESHLCGIIQNQLVSFGSYGVVNKTAYIYQFDIDTWEKVECTIPDDFNGKLNEELIYQTDSLIGIQCFGLEKYNIYKFKITNE